MVSTLHQVSKLALDLAFDLEFVLRLVVELAVAAKEFAVEVDFEPAHLPAFALGKAFEVALEFEVAIRLELGFVVVVAAEQNFVAKALAVLGLCPSHLCCGSGKAALHLAVVQAGSSVAFVVQPAEIAAQLVAFAAQPAVAFVEALAGELAEASAEAQLALHLASIPAAT